LLSLAHFAKSSRYASDRDLVRIIRFAMVSVVVCSLHAQQPEKSIRGQQSLNSCWLFKRQLSPGAAVEAEFIGAEKPDYNASSWSAVVLPHTWDATPDHPFTVPHHFRGLGWYRRSFAVPDEWQGRRVFIHFKGVCQIADVWINGQHAGSHTGGFTGFEFNITPYLKWKAPNVIAVRVNDVLDEDIAPANETNVPAYGGIYRSVYLVATDPVHVPMDGTWVTTEQSGSHVFVNIRTRLTNADTKAQEVRLHTAIEDAQGAMVASFDSSVRLAPGATTELSQQSQPLANAHLWSTDSPYLYRLSTTVWRSSEIADAVGTSFGIRFMGHDVVNGFTLNGKPINLHGVNRRQDYGFLGDAVPEQISERDIRLIKEMGANFIRTSHYPQDPVVLDACDRYGILVWEEVPNIKSYVYPPSADRTEPTYTERFPRALIANIKQQLREMIDRDRNHPSIIIWGFADDLSRYHYSEDFRELSDFTRSLDDIRWTAGRAPHVTDIVDATSTPQLIQDHHDHPDRKYIWNEWGSFAAERGREGKPFYAKLPADPGSDVSMSDSDAAVFLEGYWMQWVAIPWMGTAKWCMFDTGEVNAVGTMSLWTTEREGKVSFRWPFDDYFGVADMWRLPKDGFYFLQSQWTEKPMIHIVGHWDRKNGSPKRTVRVYSNADTIELMLNNRSLGIHRPADLDRVWTDFRRLNDPYHFTDEFNQQRLPGASLKHPPFIWDDVPYESGTLVAIGRKRDVVVRDAMRTVDAPSRIKLTAERPTLSANAADVTFVEADIVDAHGTTVPDARPWIHFSLEGPGRLLGATEMDAISGVAAINMQTTDTAGNVVISASSPGLESGSAHIRVDATAESSRP
jgi:beta-galactosidase